MASSDAATTVAAAPNPVPPTAPSSTREEGELTSSSDGDENPDSSATQSTPHSQSTAVAQFTPATQSTVAAQSTAVAQSMPAAESIAVPLQQKSTQGVQSGSINIQLQTTGQSTLQKSLIKNQLAPKSSLWNGHVGTDKNLVISFSDDDSGSDLETKGNASKLGSNVKQPSSSLVKPNKLQQNGRGVQKAMPKRMALNHTRNPTIPRNNVPSTKGVGSVSLGQGSQAKYFNPMNKTLVTRDRGHDQGVVSNDSKLQDLRQRIALRENELRLKAAQQSKESALLLGRDHSASNLKNDTTRKYIRGSSEAAQLVPKEPDRKRMKLNASYGTSHAVGNQQEIPASKSIVPSKDSTRENYFPPERNYVDHSQKEIPLCRGDPTIIRPQRQPDKHADHSLQNIPCRSRDGNVNYDGNQTEKSSRPVDPCSAFNQNAVLPNVISNSMPKNVEALSTAVLPNHNGNANVSEHKSIDLDSFFEMEALIDKELEEAQEHRHKCEIEERNALKIYLKAQRSLLEANARCTNLYHKRELCSANLRSLILNNSSLTWPSGQYQHLDMGLDYLPRHAYDIPTSSCQRLAEDNDANNPSFDSNNQGINNGHSNRSHQYVTGANLRSEPGGEPDASTSEPLPRMGHNTANGFYSPSDELDTAANENEEILLAGQPSNHLGAEYHRKQDTNAKQMDIDTVSNAKSPNDSLQDSLILEATLRSELFARFGTRAIKASSACNNIELDTERGAENEVRSDRSQAHQPLSTAGDDRLKGIERYDRTIRLGSNETHSRQNIGVHSLDSNCSAGSADQGRHSTNTMNIPPLIFRSAFSELREVSPFYSNKFQSENKFICANDGENESDTCLNSDETKWSNMFSSSMPVTSGNLLLEESSYSCSPVVDPFWPLCMYELRGKCNNDECPWQHVKDYDEGSVNQHQHADSINADFQGRLLLHQQNCNGVTKVPNFHRDPVLPTYIVSLDILKADHFAYKPVVAHRNTQCWQKNFSITLTTLNLLQNGLAADAPSLHGGDERIEVHGPWNKQLSSFQWRSGTGNRIKQAIADSEQALEMALLILNQDIDKFLGARKALTVLSKALETNATSVVLWVVYLLIFNGNIKPNEKNDLFSSAVKHCEGSYVLWLMYINNQRKLDDRLAAYDSALSGLCRHASSALKDRMDKSAHILDLLLQMLDCLCMSGNVEKAIQRSYTIIYATTKSVELHMPLSDILNFLTISDKCVFWVCCVYLVIYRKLPDAVVQKFECEKELLDIDWPFIHLLEDEKEMAVKYMETAAESIDSNVYDESVKSDVDIRSTQFFAVNHIRCMVALGRLECSRNLLDKYMKLYPSCTELVLVSARLQKQESGIESFMGFEEAISRWPVKVPGIHCIWNQYIENAIWNRQIDFAKEITARWFHSVWQDLPNGGMNTRDGDNSCGSLGLNSKTALDTSNSDAKQMDIMFGYLNLSLYSFFQNDVAEAYIAVDKARNAAVFGGLDQCMRKHVMFLLCDALSLKEDGPKGAVKKILEMYMDGSSEAFLVPKVLTRKFVDGINKPRVQLLISNILSPVSFDCSLLNLILQSLFGSSLLPHTVSDQKSLVDSVESIMEVVPYNFQLAIAVCKLICKNSSSSDLNSASLWFWACSTLVNAILVAVPIPPENVWVEAGGFLHQDTGTKAIAERFYRRALSVYPFSLMLWKCYYKLYKTAEEANDVLEAAEERGIKL